MKTLIQSKPLILMIGIVGLGALVYLAAGLSTMTFDQTQPLVLAPLSFQSALEGIRQDVISVDFWVKVLFWLMFLAFILVVTALLIPEIRKRVLRNLIRLVTFSLVLMYMVERVGGTLVQTQQTDAAQEILKSPAQPQVATFTPPEVSPVTSYIVSMCMVSLVMGVIWWQLHRRRAVRPDTPLQEIARTARAALDDLSKGKEWGDAVVQCYLKLNDIVRKRYDVHRQLGMTPSEFIERLEQIGLPSQPVRRLTALFEAVRYGAKQFTQVEVDEAVDCLRSIAQAAGRES
jgi:hypothetical protein